MKPSTAGNRKPYAGQTRNLVIALDIGTTFSGVSYAILEPTEIPKIHGVTRFPGQEHVAGNSKIPSIMYYDRAGVMKAAGAEAESASVLAQAEDEGWIKAELFKLRLRPRTMKLKMNGMRLASLPQNKTAVDVFADFLGYLFRCTKSFIVDTHANGASMWRQVERDVQFVLSHPNGWEGAQQSKMRRAAIYGGLIPDTDEGKARIRFVTEGEASLHACVLNGLAADVLSSSSGHGFVVADAGGGTLDISTYAIRGTHPLVIEEIAPPDCVFAGSVFVSRRARIFFEEKLRGSKYGSLDSVEHITKRFDETTKRLFRDANELQFVPFGSPLDRDMSVGIRGGQLKLTGAEVASLFEPSIEAAVLSIENQIKASGGAVKSVWLVGGFAASPWLFSQLQDRLATMNVTVSRPDSQTSKAVADGAIGFYCDHHVSARMSKFLYGVEFLRQFDENDEEHQARKGRLFELPSGPKLLPDAFDCILARGVKVKESMVFSRKYCTEMTNLATLSVFEVELWCYRGGDTVPKWIHRSSEEFTTLCFVRADLSPLASSATAKEGKNGKTYWTIVFNIEIHFGLTEFKARIKWVDNQRTKYGPASIVYNEAGHRAEDDEPDESPEDNVTVLSSASDRGDMSYAPSRQPSMSNGRSAAPSVQGSPTVPPSASVSRTPSSGTSHSTSRSAVDRHSGTRSRGIETPAMREGDRSVNVSGRSAESGRSGYTRLGEALNSVWGSSMSRGQTPTASRRESALVPPVGLASVREEVRGSRDFSAAATPRAPSVRDTMAPPTPRVETVPATPRDISRAPTVRESRVPTPREFSNAPTPRESTPPTPREPTAPPTPRQTTVPPTPRQATVPPTPREMTAPPTPRQATVPPTPAVVSKAPTPREVSKPPSPKEAPLEVPRSKAVSRLATPKGPSKAPTPREASRVATPKASRVPSPKFEPEPIPEVTPVAEEPPPPPAPVAEPAPEEPVAPEAPADAATPADGWADDIYDSAPGGYPEQPRSPGRATTDLPPPLDEFNASTFDNHPMGGNSPFDFGGAPPAADGAPPGSLQELLGSPGPEPVAGEGTGMFSNFLSAPSWGGGASRPSSNVGGSGLGLDKVGTGFGFGSGSGFGTGLKSLGSNWGLGFGQNSAPQEDEEAKRQAEAEAERKRQEEEAAAEAERVRLEEEAAEAERKRLEEEAQKAVEEDLGFAIKPKKGKKGKSGGGTPAAMSRAASAKAEEEKRKQEEAAAAVAEQARLAAEAQAQAEAEALEAARLEEEARQAEEAAAAEAHPPAEYLETSAPSDAVNPVEADFDGAGYGEDAGGWGNAGADEPYGGADSMGAPNGGAGSWDPPADLQANEGAGDNTNAGEDEWGSWGTTKKKEKKDNAATPTAEDPLEDPTLADPPSATSPEDSAGPPEGGDTGSQEGALGGDWGSQEAPAENAGDAPPVEANAADDEWGFPVKKKKGKKAAAATPGNMSRTASNAPEADGAAAGGGGPGGKKKGKKK